MNKVVNTARAASVVVTLLLVLGVPGAWGVVWDDWDEPGEGGGIQCEGITEPDDGAAYACSSEVTLSVADPADQDEREAPGGTTYPADTFNPDDAFTWSAKSEGEDVGGWKEDNTGQSVVWIAPGVPNSDVEITVIINDDAEQNGEAGDRNDDDLPLTVHVKVVKVDLDIAATTEDNEETVGGFAALNDDDDNQNSTADKDETGTVTGEDDLIPISISFEPETPDTGELRLDVSPGELKVKVWTSSTKGEWIGGNYKVWELSEGPPPETLYLEGVQTSSSVRDVKLKLTYEDPNLQKCDDTVRATVVDVDLKQVSFSGDKYHVVRMDDDSADYAAPHWQDNSTPLDGDADDDGDCKYPVCFTRNTKMKTSVTIIVAPTDVLIDDVKIKGDGPDNLDIPESAATVNNDQVTITDVECANAFPNEVKWYGDDKELKVQWYISRDGGASWLGTMASGDEAFITLGTPACAKRFRTVLYLACKKGGTDPDSCLTQTWAMFAGPANVKAWNETEKAYSKELYYYDNHSGDNVYSAKGLLAGGNGQCLAWADLLKECLVANNVANVKRTVVLPPAGWAGFGVREIGFDDANPEWPAEPIWKYAITDWDGDGREIDDLDIRITRIPGQNKNPPFAKLFNLHWIVHRTGDATYYDPSYGVTTTDPDDYTTEAIGAWILDAWWFHCCRVTSVQAAVSFFDQDW